MKSPKTCPYGEKLQSYWDKRYQYFHLFDEGIQIDAEGLHTVMPEKAALDQAMLLSDAKVVLDGFCGVGGITIALARSGKQVIAVDSNIDRIEMARINANVYGVEDQITFIHGDFFDVAAKINADVVVIDPPWGWPRYRKINDFCLEHFTPHGETLLRFVLNHFDVMLLRTPKNFKVSELDRLEVDYTVHGDKLNNVVISNSIIIKPGRLRLQPVFS